MAMVGRRGAGRVGDVVGTSQVRDPATGLWRKREADVSDMDLREVLAEAPCVVLDQPFCNRDHGRGWLHPECVLARLTRPDVLDEFERQFGLGTLSLGSMNGVVRLARRVLADMLGGES